MTMGADPVACAALAGGARAKAFFVRKDAKAHGLQRRIEGPPLDREDRCVVVEDVVTTGGSTLAAIEALQEAGHEICGVISVLDRLAGGGAAIERAAGAPYVPLTTIDEVYPERPDRAGGLTRVATRRRPSRRAIRAAAPRGRAAAARAVRRARRVRAPGARAARRPRSSSTEALFGERPAAEALIAERDSEAVGYALFFPTFSTLPRDPGGLARGPVRAPGAPRRGRRPGAARGRRGAPARARRRAPGMGGARLERARARLLPRPRRAARWTSGSPTG